MSNNFDHKDAKNFTIIYNKYYTPLYLFAKKILPTAQDAEDIVNEVFFKLWKREGYFQSMEQVRPYLFVMIRNTSIDFLRSGVLKYKAQKDISYLLGNESDEDSTKIIEIEGEVFNAIYTEIKKLKPKYQEIYKLSFIEGLKNEEIASYLKISNKSVRNIKTNIRNILKENLTQHNN